MSSKNGRMLKDFLQDGSLHHSSSPFESFPRRIPDYFDDMASGILSRAQAAFASFQKLLQAVKSLHYSSTQPSTLQRSVSRGLLGRLYMKKRSSNKSSGEVVSSKIVVVSVRVKDILRWRSFRDLAVDNNQIFVEEGAEEFQPLDFMAPADDAPSTSHINSSNGSDMSWGAGDFTAAEETAKEEELPCFLGNCGDDEGKKWDYIIFASDSGVGPREDKHKIASEEDTEQQSPISVFESPFRDEVSDEEFPSSFDQKMANMERTKQRLMQSILWFENLAGVHEDETDSVVEEDDEIEAKCEAYSSKRFPWCKRGVESLEDKTECIKSMEKQGQWIKFSEERTELGGELEVRVLSDLLDEVLVDF